MTHNQKIKSLESKIQELETKRQQLVEKRRTSLASLLEKTGIDHLDNSLLAGAFLEIKSKTSAPSPDQTLINQWTEAGQKLLNKKSKKLAS